MQKETHTRHRGLTSIEALGILALLTIAILILLLAFGGTGEQEELTVTDDRIAKHSAEVDISKETMIVLTASPEDIVREKHICWKAERDRDDILLIEIVEVHYKHPQAKDQAVIPQYEPRIRRVLDRFSNEAAALRLLLDNEISVSNQFKSMMSS